MYHQFKQLADIDITQEPMEVGPTTHYMMGGIRVDADTQMSTVPGLFAAGECAAGLHGANRLGAIPSPTCWCLANAPGLAPRSIQKTTVLRRSIREWWKQPSGEALAPFDRKRDSKTEGPYQVQQDLQKMMQRLVGIVRIEEEMQQAMNGIAELWSRARNVSVTGNREYNSGWHTALDLPNLLIVAEAITQSALRRKESRGAHFREDHSTKDAASGKMNLVVLKQRDGTMRIEQRPVVPMPGELQQIIEEMK